MTDHISPQLDLEHLRGWIGRREEAEDVVTPRLTAGLLAVLDHPETSLAEGDLAPLAIHWCLAPPIRPTSQLGLDGHPLRGGMLPPVPLPRRMWAGGALEFPGRIRVGDRVRRQSVVRDVTLKQGRSGPLCFVTVDHEFFGPDGLVLRERHDIVYRAAGGAAPMATPVAPVARWQEGAQASAVQLFRYSAITFNGHRIHYDRDYATGVEGYAGLVVHGPLQATLLLDFAARLELTPPQKFTFRGVSPLLDGPPFTLNAAERADGGLDLWTADTGGRLCMTATATW